MQLETIIFGRLDLPPLVNYIILLAKQYIIRQKLWAEGQISMSRFKDIVRRQYEDDRLTATKNERLDGFERKWAGFIPIT